MKINGKNLMFSQNFGAKIGITWAMINIFLNFKLPPTPKTIVRLLNMYYQVQVVYWAQNNFLFKFGLDYLGLRKAKNTPTKKILVIIEPRKWFKSNF